MVRSNFLEDDIVGCIFGYASSILRIVVVDWKTRGVACINTGVEVRRPVVARDYTHLVMIDEPAPYLLDLET